MATQQDLDMISSTMQEIPGMVNLCQEVIKALVETTQCCIRKNPFLSFLMPTDYNLARNHIINRCFYAQRRLQNVRKDIISPDLIRAASDLSTIRYLCESCEKINRSNLLRGKKFSCQINEKYGKISTNTFRYELDSIGRIIEKL
jgi:hypothetical protein